MGSARACQQGVEQQLRTGARLSHRHLRARGENVRQAVQALRIARRHQQSLFPPRHADQHRVVKAGRDAHRGYIGIARGIGGQGLAVEMDCRRHDLAALQALDAAPGAFVEGGETRARFAQAPFQQRILAAADDRRRFRHRHAGRPRHPGEHPEIKFMPGKQPFAGHFAAGNGA